MTSIEKAINRLRAVKSSDSENVVDREMNRPSDRHPKEAISPVSENGFQFDYDAMEKGGMLTPRQMHNELSEDYRNLKRPIIMNARRNSVTYTPKNNLVLITSALQGEGKTFTTLNLAMSIAMERDTTVLVIDGDTINPALSRYLGLTDRLGLSDLLRRSDLDLKDVIISSDIENLKIVPAGSMETFSAEYYASNSMKALMDELSNRYSDRIVLIDGLPLLETSQVKILIHYVGQILVVVEAAKTPQMAVKEALSFIDNKDVITGVVLNKATKSRLSGSYYGYGYRGYGKRQ